MAVNRCAWRELWHGEYAVNVIKDMAIYNSSVACVLRKVVDYLCFVRLISRPRMTDNLYTVDVIRAGSREVIRTR